jgi:SAM-dependent methyltransferase
LNRPCPLCGNHDVSPKWNTNHLIACPDCQLVYVDPVPDAEALERIYTQDYFIGGTTSDYYDYPGEKQALQANFRQRIGMLQRYSTGGTLLEIGCAYGFFLELAQHVWQVKGSDISADAVEYARTQLGLDVESGSIESLTLPAAAFDVVAMWDTIEHLYDPVLAVQKAGAALRPGGLLALTTGDIGGLLPRIQKTGWRLYQPNHLYYFSKPSMTHLLDQAGFDLEYFGYEGVYRTPREMSKVLVWGREHVQGWRSRLHELLRRGGRIMDIPIPLNTFDIMFVIARKRTNA